MEESMENDPTRVDQLAEESETASTDFAAAMEDAADAVTPGRAERFYDRVRRSIQSYVDRKGKVLGRTADFLLLVPDGFILLVRLSADSRVSGKTKGLLGSGIAYYVFPLDLIPEAIVGPIGYLDDLVFAAYILK